MSGARIPVVVTPKSGRDVVDGWRGTELIVRVTAAPEGGKANEAVCRILAKSLSVPKSTACVVIGSTSRHKVVEVSGIEIDDVYAILGEPQPGLF